MNSDERSRTNRRVRILRAEAALADLLADEGLWDDDRRKLETALRVLRGMA